MTALQAEYEKDFHRWIELHIDLLENGHVHELDTAHLIEELKDMANRDRNELVSHLKILIAHLLKWQFQFKHFAESWQHAGDYAAKSWQYRIVEQRSEIHDQLENIPSLKKHLDESVNKAYPKAVALATKETGLMADTFPHDCPYSLEQLLDDGFYPEAE
jgi:hypothetical protein